jgi:transcriptional regulator with XRE-family HTH domain
MLSFAQRLQTALAYRGKLKSWLEKETGIPQPMLSKYYNGLTIPSVDKVSIMTHALQVNPAFMLGLTDDPAPIGELTIPPESYSYDEIRLVHAYREASDADKEIIHVLLDRYKPMDKPKRKVRKDKQTGTMDEA